MQRPAVEHLDVDPFVFAAEIALIVAAEIVDAPGDQRADVGGRKALFKLFVRALVHNLLDRVQQVLVAARNAHRLAHIGRAFDHAVGLAFQVDAVDRIVGIAQDLQAFLGLAPPAVVQRAADQKAHAHKRKQHAEHRQQHNGAVPAVLQDDLDRDGDDRKPAVIHLIVIHGAAHAVHIAHGRIVGFKPARADVLHELGHIRAARVVVQFQVA